MTPTETPELKFPKLRTPIPPTLPPRDLNGFLRELWGSAVRACGYALTFWVSYIVLAGILKMVLINFGIFLQLPRFGELFKTYVVAVLTVTAGAALIEACAGALGRRRLPRLQIPLMGSVLTVLFLSPFSEGIIFERLHHHLQKLVALPEERVQTLAIFGASAAAFLWLFVQKKKSRSPLAAFLTYSFCLQAIILAAFFDLKVDMEKSRKILILLCAFALILLVHFSSGSVTGRFALWAGTRPLAASLFRGLAALTFVLGLAYESALSIPWSQKFSRTVPGESAGFFSRAAAKLIVLDPGVDYLETREVFNVSHTLRRRPVRGEPLRFSIGVRPLDWDRHQERFVFTIRAAGAGDAAGTEIYRKVLAPYRNVKHRAWREVEVSLDPFAGREITLTFSSSVEAPENDGDTPPVENPAVWSFEREGDFRRKPGEYNIVLLSLDTLRADRLGVAGYFRDTSPHLDRLARQGVYFREAISPAPWTTPAHMSAMTGLYPSFHGLLEPPGQSQTELSAEHVTLAEILRAHGYRTKAFTGSAAMAANYGFFQGFDQYAETVGRVESDWHDTQFVFPYAFRWLDKHRQDKFFLFLHTYTIHAPYRHNYFLDKDPAIQNASEDAQTQAHYDSGIRYADDWVGKLIEKLDELKLSRNTILIVMSDHGEDLNERYALEHGHTLYDELIRVPLIFYAPGLLAPRRVEHYQAELTDIMPTTLDLAGLPRPEGEIQGESLMSILAGGPVPEESLALSEAISYGPERKSLRHVKGESARKFIFTPDVWPIRLWLPPTPPFSARDEAIRQFQRASWTNFIRECGGREFYDLRRDPGEKRNVFSPDNRESAFLLSKIEAYIESARKFLKTGSAKAELDPDAKERLKSLGYLQ